MIKEIIKYYSDIDCSKEFSTKEEAENFERIYKPFYELSNEADLKWTSIKTFKDSYNKSQEIAKDLFDKAKKLLDEYLNEKNIIAISLVERLHNIKFNEDDIYYVSTIFENGECGEDWDIIGKLFDTIYCIIFNH